MTTTNKILLGLGVGTIGYAVYYNWEWIQRKMLGNVSYGYSSGFGTQEDVIILDGVQYNVVDNGNEVISAGNQYTEETITQIDYSNDSSGGTSETITFNVVSNTTPLMPSYDYDFVTFGTVANVQVSQIGTGTFQFIPLTGDLSLIDVDGATVETLSVAWDFGDGFGSKLNPSFAPVSQFPTTGIYPIKANFYVGSQEEGETAVVAVNFELQVIIPL